MRSRNGWSRSRMMFRETCFFGHSKLMTKRWAGCRSNIAVPDTLNSCVRYCRFMIPKSCRGSVSSSRRAVDRRKNNFAKRTCRRQLLELPPYKSPDAWRSSGMSLLPPVKDVVLFSIFDVFNNLKIVETVSRKNIIWRMRSWRTLHVSLSSIFSHGDWRPPADVIKSTKRRSPHQRDARRRALERLSRGYYLFRPSLSATPICAQNFFGCVWRKTNICSKLGGPAPDLTVTVGTHQEYLYPWTCVHVLIQSMRCRSSARNRYGSSLIWSSWVTIATVE